MPFLLLTGLVLFATQSFASAIHSENYRNYVTTDVGYNVMPIIGTGLTVGSHMDQNHSFEFSYSRGERNVSYAVLKAELYSFKFKKFWTSSLYTNTGIAFKNVGDRTTERVSSFFVAERQASSYGLDFVIGQRWEINRITYGIDWLGFFQPIQTEQSRSFTRLTPPQFAMQQQGTERPAQRSTEGSRSQGSHMNYDSHENDWRRLAEHPTLQVLRAYIGFHF